MAPKLIPRTGRKRPSIWGTALEVLVVVAIGLAVWLVGHAWSAPSAINDSGYHVAPEKGWNAAAL